MRIYQLRIPFPEKYRSKISKVVLDWAERLPKFQAGYIHSLQEKRVNQHGYSQKTFDRTRPPKDTELELLSIRILEFFQYEEFQNLRASLERMFPSLDKFRLGQPFKEYFDKFGDSLGSGGWINIGWIYRERKPLGPNHCLHLPNLPTEVDHIEIHLHKILPSSIIISMDVLLNNKASNQLKILQNSMYLPEARIESILLHDKLFGVSSWSSERSMEQAITGELSRIRKDVESAIRPYLYGEFMRQSNGNTKLPAIEVYGLKGIKKQKNNFSIWANKAEGWSNSLGFEFYLQTFNNRKLAFHWAHNSLHTETMIPSRVLVFWESYLKDMNIEMYGRDEAWAIAYSINHGFLNSILTPLSTIEFLNQKVENVKRFRSTLYANMIKRKFRKQNLQKQLNLFSELQDEIRKTERFILEFDQFKKSVGRDLKESNIDQMYYTDLRQGGKAHVENLKENICSRIDYLRKTFNDHMNFLNKSFSTHVEYLNINAIYRLQIMSLILSIIALLVTFFGILGNWKDIVDLFRYILSRI